MHEDISVLMPSSVIPTHPQPTCIVETLQSVREHLPESPIYVMCDGIRPEMKHRRAAYNTYIENLKQLNLPGVTVINYETFHHQVAMTRRTIWDYVKTPYMLFAEHDTPLVSERFIDFNMFKYELENRTNMIRLHYDESIHPDHQHMMRGHLTPNLIRTVQWHQRPHVAKVDWYIKILTDWFSTNARTFVEDRMYSPCSFSEWEEFKLTIYDPHGDGQRMKRSRDIDGRGDDPKFDTDLVY